MKNVFDIAIDTMAAAHRQNNPPEPEDYRDEEGLLCCGKCHTRKEGVYDFGEHGKKVLPFLCKCQTEERDRREAEEKQRKFREECERRRKDGITDPSYLVQTFDQDDGRNQKTSEVCLKYVDHWEEMKADNMENLTADSRLDKPRSRHYNISIIIFSQAMMGNSRTNPVASESGRMVQGRARTG